MLREGLLGSTILLCPHGRLLTSHAKCDSNTIKVVRTNYSTKVMLLGVRRKVV